MGWVVGDSQEKGKIKTSDGGDGWFSCKGEPHCVIMEKSIRGVGEFRVKCE